MSGGFPRRAEKTIEYGGKTAPPPNSGRRDICLINERRSGRNKESKIGRPGKKFDIIGMGERGTDSVRGLKN